jgi:hypothetical protein
MIDRKELTLDSKEPLTGSYIEERDTLEHLDIMQKFHDLNNRVEKITDSGELF